MSQSWDVVVVGGGLAGRVAALAASDVGASVHVIAAAEDELRHGSGLVDVLGYDPQSGDPIARPFDHLGALPQEHPYSTLDEPTVQDAMSRLSAALGDRYAGFDSPRNGLVGGQLGIPTPAFGYPTAVEPGLLSRDDNLLLVDIAPLPDFDASIAARNLQRADVPFDVDSGSIDLTDVLAPDVSRLRIAQRLDVEMTMEPAEREVLPALHDALLERSAGFDRVGIPAILGINHAEWVHKLVGEALEAAVFEIPTGPQSVLGIRLDRALDAAVAETDAYRTQGPSAVDFRATGGRIEAVAIDRDGATEWVVGDSFVLATGGLIGGGLEGRDDRIVEPLFDCHVAGAPTDERWTTQNPFDKQPFATVGISTDDELRPVDEAGVPEFANLRAAGDVLGGFDPVAEGSGAGVAAATGYAAGRKAAREVLGS
jgi:glycerol-3-phosphate dehydrogenase subunit B